MPTPITCHTPGEISSALGIVDAARVGWARAEADDRTIDYALGSGEADEVALYAGVKPLIRQVLAREGVAGARARFERLGLSVAETVHRVATPTTDGSVLFVGRDPRRVREAVACEADSEHDRELGRLLGYPACCVEAYLELPVPRRNAAAFARAAAASEGEPEPRLDTLDLAIFHYVSWLPCSFSCGLALGFANAVADHIARRHGQFLAASAERRRQHGRHVCPPNCRHERFVRAIDEALSSHRVLLTEDVQVSIEGTFRGGEVHVDRAWPTARDRHPEIHLDPEAREAVARLTALVEARRTVAIDRGVLYAGGVPILATADALLVPFGARKES